MLNHRRVVAAILALALTLAPAAAGSVLAVGPVAVDDAYFVYEDQVLIVPAPGILGNDGHDPGTSPCVVAFDTVGLQGNLGPFASDGSFSFTPLANWNGNTAFDYDMAEFVVGPCSGLLDTGTVALEVRPVNDAPTAVLANTCDDGVSVAEDSGAYDDPGHCVELQSLGPADEATQTLGAWVVSTDHLELFSSGPSVSVVDGTFGRLQFTPAPNAHGSATVTVRGRDSGGTENGGVDLSAAVTFTVTITPANDAPRAFADSFIVLADRTLNIKSPGVLFNDSDIDGDTITAVKVTSPAHGTVTLAADGAFSYTPVTGYRGLDAFSYRASDGSATSPARIVTLTVSAIPTPSPSPIPTAAASSAPSPEPTASDAAPSASIEAPPSLLPGASAAETPFGTTTASAGPDATPAPGPAAGSSGLSLPVLLVIVLLGVLLAFGAAMLVPRWLNTSRTGRPPDEG